MRLFEAKFSQSNKAMSDVNIVSIPREALPAVLTKVSQLTGVPEEDLNVVGSAGKAELSGDLDIAIDANKYTPFKVHHRISKAVGEEYSNYNNGIRVGNYAIPVSDVEDWRIQIDLMFVDNVEWARFSYFSAGENSQFKGAVRAVLLSAVAASLDEKGIDAFHYEGDELIVRVGRGIDLATGLKRLFQMRPHKKYGEGYVKALKNVDPEDIRQMYPKLEFDDDQIVINDPLQVVQILFGPGTRPSNVDTAEEVLELINRFPPGKRDKILSIAKIRAKQLAAKGFDLPEEIR